MEVSVIRCILRKGSEGALSIVGVEVCIGF